MLAKIIINRKSQWMNRMRDFKIFVDDKEAGRVKNGSAEEIVVEEGAHVIFLKYGFYKSERLTVTLNKSENKFLLAQNGMKYFWILYALLLLALLAKPVIKNMGIEMAGKWLYALQIALFTPGLLYMLYYMTLGRKKYLLLEEDHDNIFNS